MAQRHSLQQPARFWCLKLCGFGNGIPCGTCCSGNGVASAAVLHLSSKCVLHGKILDRPFWWAPYSYWLQNLSRNSWEGRFQKKGGYCISRQVRWLFQHWPNSLVIGSSVSFITGLELLCPLGIPILEKHSSLDLTLVTLVLFERSQRAGTERVKQKCQRNCKGATAEYWDVCRMVVVGMKLQFNCGSLVDFSQWLDSCLLPKAPCL